MVEGALADRKTGFGKGPLGWDSSERTAWVGANASFPAFGNITFLLHS